MVVGWSGNYIAGKVALQTFPPLFLYGLRISMAGALILPVYWWQSRRHVRTWTRADLPMLFLLGILGAALTQFCFVMGLSRTSVAHSVIFANLTPILVLFLANARGMEKITPRKLLGVFVALVGVLLLRWLDINPHGAAPTLLGDLLTFCGSITFALYTVIGKPYTKRYGSVTVNTFAYTGGALLMAPVTVWQSAHFRFAGATWGAWATVFYMALVPSVICYLIYYHALAHLDATRLATFSYVQPPLATVMGIFLLGEHVTVSLVFAAVVIFAGVYLTEGAP